MDSSKWIFVETTIQIEKIVEESNRRREILNNLKGRKLVTSAYVLMQFKSTLISDCIALYTIAKDVKDMGDFHVRFSKIKPHEPRVIRRCEEIFGKLTRDGMVDDIEKLRERLKNYIEFVLLDGFMEGIKEICDSTKCQLAKEEPIWKDGGYQLNTKCTKELKQCILPEFVNENQELFSKITDVINYRLDDFNLRKEKKDKLKEASIICKKILENTEESRGNNCRNHLSDFIIAIETPDDAEIYTTDNDFNPICLATGKKIFRENQSYEIEEN